MKRINAKKLFSVLAVMLVFAAMCAVSAFADGGDPTIGDAANKIADFIKSLRGPILAVVGAAGSLYCILLGVKYAKAEEPQDREKAKSHLKNAIIGFVLIFILMVALSFVLPALTNWVEDNELSQEISQ